MPARVISIYTAKAEGAPMQSHHSVELVEGSGIVGDRYATGEGHFSDRKYADKQLTLVEAEVAERVGLTPDQTRRNVVTRGIVLESLIGKTFRIGDTEIRGIRPCDPCAYLESLTRPGLVKDMLHKGGLRAEILRGGQVSVGDELILESGERSE
jgi:MOSC domain-containing protein YiiM